EVVLPIVFADFLNGNDVLMVKLRRSLGFDLESSHECRIGELTVQQHLHRDKAIEAELSRAIDHAHSASANFFQQFVITEVTNRLTFDFGISILAIRWRRGLAGERNHCIVQAALEQASSTKTLRCVRAQFSPATGA